MWEIEGHLKDKKKPHVAVAGVQEGWVEEAGMVGGTQPVEDLVGQNKLVAPVIWRWMVFTTTLL